MPRPASGGKLWMPLVLKGARQPSSSPALGVTPLLREVSFLFPALVGQWDVDKWQEEMEGSHSKTRGSGAVERPRSLEFVQQNKIRIWIL